MEIEKYGIAIVVKALVECNEKLREAMSGAQLAKDEPLYCVLYKKQTELWDLIATLVKDKKELTNG